MRSWSRVLLTALAPLLVVVAGCSSVDSQDSSSSAAPSSSSAAPTPTQAPAPPAAPRKDDCYALGYDQAVAPTDDQQPVDCDQSHTAQTYVVGTLRSVADGHLLAVDSDAVQRDVAATCPQRLAAFLGGTVDQLRLSLLRSVWFTPTVADSDAGATWFRCDVVAAYGDQRLAELSGNLRGALRSAATRDDFAMCATDRPGEADFQRVLCRDPHSWKAIRTVDLSGLAGSDGRFPGLAAVKQGEDVDGSHVCADAARDIASDALDYQWGYEWPTADQWRTGQTYGRCWAPDPGSDPSPSPSS